VRIETRPFAPRLAIGQRLRFRVRAVPSVQRKPATGGRSRRLSVVMDLPAGAPEVRRAHADEAALAWLGQRTEANGFALLTADVTDIRRVRAARRGDEPILLGTAEFEGLLAVTAPSPGFPRGCTAQCGTIWNAVCGWNCRGCAAA
jgi:CRISPR system Cascade subunit CasE